MMRFLLFLILFQFSITNNASNDLVLVSVIIKNQSDLDFKEGTLQLDQSSKLVFSILANAKNEFLIPKGKHEMQFVVDGFSSRIIKPKRINKRNNTIEIILFSKTVTNSLLVEFEAVQSDLNTNNFIIPSFGTNHPEGLNSFKEKYGIGFSFEACMIDPFSSDRARKTNTKIAELLTKKFGEQWKQDLPIIPLGIPTNHSTGKSK